MLKIELNWLQAGSKNSAQNRIDIKIMTIMDQLLFDDQPKFS